MRRLTLGVLFAGLTAASLTACAGKTNTTQSPDTAYAAPQIPADPANTSESTPTVQDTAAELNRPWIDSATTSDFLLIGKREQTFGVWVDVPERLAVDHVPTAMTLTIDTSGSMRGAKIAHAREAAARLINALHDGDQIGIVTFSDRARVLVPPQEIDHHSRQRILNLVEELSADGGTAMHEGLRVAESQLWNTSDSHLVRRLVMISDGKATVGPTEPEELGRVAEVGVDRGIQVTSIGVGVQYDEHTLNTLAIRTSGRLHHVERSAQLPGIVEKEMSLLEATAVADARIELVAAPGVSFVGTDTARSQWGQNRQLVVPLGSMFKGQRRQVLVRAMVDGDGHEGPRVLASVRLHFRDPAEDGLARVQESVLRATMTDDPDLVAAHENSRMQTLLAVREASSMTSIASKDLNSGDFDKADLALAKAEKKLEQRARHAKTKSERKQVEQSVKRVRRSRAGIRAAKKKPPAARPAAARSLSLEANDAAMDADGF